MVGNVTSIDVEALAQRLPQLLSEERQVQTEFLIALAAFDRARGYERFGHPGLWEYCRETLGLLEGAIFRRVHAARLLDRFPQVKDLLLDGRLFMTTLVQLEKVITEENADELFAAASGKSKKDVAYLVACRLPQELVPEVGAVVRKVLAVRRAEASVVASECSTSTLDADSVAAAAAAAATASVPGAMSRPATVLPVAEDRFTIKLTVSKAFVDALEEARLALSHRVPGGEVEAVLRAALDDVIAREAKRNAPREERRRAPSAPLPFASGSGSRKAIAAAIRREVWNRDGGRCVWRKSDGSGCGSRWQVQLDHIVAFAKGGDSSVANLRLLCFAHNGQHARETFGERHMLAARSNASTSAGGGRVEDG